MEAFRRSEFALASDFASFPQFLRNEVVDEVVMALPFRSLHAQAAGIATLCEEQGITVRVLTNIFDLKLARASAFEMPTTLQAYPHAVRSYLRNLGRARNASGLWTYMSCFRKAPTWVDLGKRLFDEVLKYGGIWHLYGHSWEIDELAIWGQLRELLEYVCKCEGVIYATNGQLLSRISCC